MLENHLLKRMGDGGPYVLEKQNFGDSLNKSGDYYSPLVESSKDDTLTKQRGKKKSDSTQIRNHFNVVFNSSISQAERIEFQEKITQLELEMKEFNKVLKQK